MLKVVILFLTLPARLCFRHNFYCHTSFRHRHILSQVFSSFPNISSLSCLHVILESKMTSSSSVALLIKTADFAAKKHKDQRRKDPSQTPYINHPIGVAQILSEEGGVEDIAVLQAALLHDTVEDTDTTLEELQEFFGSKVARIVEEVTDDKLKCKEERKRLQVETTGHKSREAKLVKMADKIYNLRDLERVLPTGWDEARRYQYFLWARSVVVQCYEENSALASILKDMFARNIKS